MLFGTVWNELIHADERQKRTGSTNFKKNENIVRVDKRKKSSGSTNSKENEINNMRCSICKEGLKLYQTCKNNSNPNFNSMQ